MKTDSQLIDELGGPSEITRIVLAKAGIRISSQAISQWKNNGIPPAWKLALFGSSNEEKTNVTTDQAAAGPAHTSSEGLPNGSGV